MISVVDTARLAVYFLGVLPLRHIAPDTTNLKLGAQTYRMTTTLSSIGGTKKRFFVITSRKLIVAREVHAPARKTDGERATSRFP
jgi:hypothetical protein